MTTTTAMSRTAETWRAQRYRTPWRIAHRAMPADREESPVHEPGDEDGATDEAEEVAEGAEEDELERAHRAERVGRAGGTDPARRARRRGGRQPLHSRGYSGGSGAAVYGS